MTTAVPRGPPGARGLAGPGAAGLL